MVWSNWRGAVVVMSAWVGLAWSQGPAPTSPAGPCERIMTVHENGKSIRCRIVSTWRTPEGSQAYQLQALNSGETITIVEDGPAASMEEPTLAGKVKALPMRIFHWGRNRATPPGVPASPEPVASSEPIVLDAPQTDASPTCASGCPVVTTKSIGKEQTVWWEEKNGKRVSPMIVTEGKNPFEQATIHTMPATGAPPIIAERTNTSTTGAGVPVVVDAPTPAPAPQAAVVTTTPPSKSMAAEGPLVSSTTVGEVAAIKVTPPPSRPIVTAAPAAPVTTTPIAKDNSETKSTTAPKLPDATTLNIAVGQANSSNAFTPPPAISATQPPVPYAQTGLTPLANAPQPLRADPASAAQPSSTANPYPTTAEAAANVTPPPAPVAPARATLADRIHNLLHPKRETTVVTPPETKQVAAGAPRTDSQVATTPASAPARTVPFSTAADQSARAGSVPPPPPNVQAAATANPSAPPPASMTAPNAGDPAMGQAATNLPAPQPTPTAAKKDWRTMWGQPKDTKAQLPGQSLVDQASAKPNVPGLPSLDNPPVAGHLPPTSLVSKQAADILLSPEKFDPAGSRLIPKGISMSSYHGDPAALKTKATTSAADTTVAQNGSNPSPLLQTTAMQAPPLPGKDGRVPLGTQSIMAANGTSTTSPAYMPAPPLNVPEPYRTPAPPAPRLPEPAPANAYANAFTPAPPPPNNAMTANAFSNMNVQPNATQVSRNIPQAPIGRADDFPSAYQPNPMAQGYPVTPGYPPNANVMMAQGMPNPYYHNAQGQMPPPLPAPAPPVAAAKSVQPYAAPQFPSAIPADARQPIQAAKYSQSSASQTATNVAMDRWPAAPGASGAELAQVLKVLRESPYPAQREWASNTLGTYDWRAHPEVVQLLLQAAQQDPAATVRASCVYSLAHMNAASEPVISTLYMLRNDGDPRVRQEVEQALVRLKN